MFRRAAFLALVTVAMVACGGDPTDTGPDAGNTDPGGGQTVPDAGSSDVQAPSVRTTVPVNGSSEVSRGSAFVVTFSEPMDVQTVRVELSPTVSLDTPSWNAEKDSVSYTALVELSPGTLYTVTVTGKDIAGNALSGGSSFSFRTESPDTTAPTVSTTTPASGATGVSSTDALRITFSEPMDTGTVAVDISPSVALQLSWDAESTTLTALPPQEGFAYGTEYTVTASGSDLAGNALSGTRSFSFTTASPPDTTVPTVTSNSPADGATGVSTSSNISLAFSESMDRLSVENALVANPNITCTFAWNTASTLVTCIPVSALSFSTQYTVTLGTGAQDPAGNGLAAAHSFSFQTASAPDTTAPTVTGSTPAHDSKGNTRYTTIAVTFSEPMDKASAQTAFAITSPTGFNAGTFSWNTEGTVMTFNPDLNFEYGTLVYWKVSSAAKDLAGNAMTSDVSRWFRVAYLGSKNLYSVASLDGSIYNDGVVYNTGTVTWNGDLSTGKFSRGFYSFDLGGLTGTVVRINSAYFYLYQSTKYGAPDTELGTFWVQSVDYGTSLEAADFDTTVLQTYQCRYVDFKRVCGMYDEQLSLSVSSTGQKSLLVTRKVRDDWNNSLSRGKRSQFRLRFNTDASYDSNSDYVTFYTSESTTNRPYLQVEYEYE